jgi:flagellar basal-body rod protein FlgG
MRALWASASGLSSMQTKIDVIANNVANVNTTGYKSSDVQFADLLTQTLKRDSEQRDPNLPLAYDLPLGHGVRPIDQEASFAQGALKETGLEYDLALDGIGFFAVEDAAGNVYYTRNGKFQLDRDGYLVNDQGFRVLDTNGQVIHVDKPSIGRAAIEADGTIRHPGLTKPHQIGIFVPVRNTGTQEELMAPEGIFQPMGEGLFVPTVGGNVAVVAANRNGSGIHGNEGAIRQGFLEQSNVDLVQEMTDLIKAQRVYQLNARAVETEDQMMGMANSMRA